jgi:hypothetical protein
MRWVLNLALATLVVGGATPRLAHGQASLPSTTVGSPLVTTNRTLLQSLNRISSGSPLWRDAIAAVADTGRRVLVATPADVVMTGRRDRYAFEDSALAEAIPVFDEESRITSVVVVVNLRLMQKLHDSRLSAPRDFEADLDRVLVHEVYAHAVPYLLAGDRTGQCPDPRPGEAAYTACAIVRENAVRAQLGLGLRSDSGLASLAITALAR